MFRIDFGWCMLENVKELLMFVFLHLWAWACVLSLDSYVCSFVLEALHTWEWACVRKFPAYIGFDPRMWDAWQKPYSANFHFFFIYFTSICNLNTLFCHFCTWIPLYPSLYLHSCIENIIFHQFCLNQESNVLFLFSFFLFFAVIIPLYW